MSQNVVIADDHEVVREGLRTIFARSGLTVCAEAGNSKELLKAVKKLHPDIVVLDVLLGADDGLQALARIKLDHPKIAVVMLSEHDNPTYIARAVALGASGYISKSCTSDEIVEAVQGAARGENIWPEETLRRVSGALTVPSKANAIDGIRFTKREEEVLKQLAFGLSTKEIAQVLGISYETVKEHVQHALRKIGVTDRTQAAVWAVRNNLV